MRKIITLIFFIVGLANAKEGDICHDQWLGYYSPGVIEIHNNVEVCNFWKFINIDLLNDNDRYELENYIEEKLSGNVIVVDEEYDFSNDVIIDEYK